MKTAKAYLLQSEDGKFHDEVIGGDSKSIGVTITELWIILERYVKGLCISFLKVY